MDQLHSNIHKSRDNLTKPLYRDRQVPDQLQLALWEETLATSPPQKKKEKSYGTYPWRAGAGSQMIYSQKLCSLGSDCIRWLGREDNIAGVHKSMYAIVPLSATNTPGSADQKTSAALIQKKKLIPFWAFEIVDSTV